KHEPAAAIPLLEEIIEKHPKQPVFSPAVELLLETWQRDPRVNTDLAYLDSILRRLGELSGPMQQAEKADLLPAFTLSLSRKRAELLDQHNQPLEAAKLFQSLAETYPADASAGDLWNNAAYAFRRAGAVDQALKVILAVSEKKPTYARLPTLYFKGAVWLYE